MSILVRRANQLAHASELEAILFLDGRLRTLSDVLEKAKSYTSSRMVRHHVDESRAEIHSTRMQLRAEAKNHAAR